MDITLIACINNSGGLGKNGELLYNISPDLQRFKRLTKDNIVIMGRKTMDSIIERNGKPLPNRTNVVLTNDKDYKAKIEQDIIVYNDVETLINQLKQRDTSQKVYVIGGQTLYEQLLPYTDMIELTVVDDNSLDFDAQFPINGLIDFHIVNRIAHKKVNEYDYDYEFITYKRN